MSRRGLRITLIAMGLFHVGAALWPLLSFDSYAYVVGPKGDHFEVDVAASLVLVIGAVLLLGGVQRRPQSGIILLGIASALAIAVVDAAYAPVLRNVRWVEFAVELAFAALLAWFGIVRA